ncbi:MAG: OmpH family outer membrane protein [Candidatus Rokubacteria bacterium]|nr:OmpH family outer membrane protein [Candidatus Rokubacteria bacterium]
MGGVTIRVVQAGMIGLALLLGASAAAQSPSRIGYVDVQRILARSSAGVAAREQIERDKASMQKDVDGKRTELEKLRDELDKKGLLLSPEARKEKQETLERKARDLRRLIDDYQKELEKKEQGLLQKVLQELSGIIERYGKQRGYLIIVEKRGAGVVYGASEADLTDEIIKAYDQEAGRAKK